VPRPKSSPPVSDCVKPGKVAAPSPMITMRDKIMRIVLLMLVIIQFSTENTSVFAKIVPNTPYMVVRISITPIYIPLLKEGHSPD